VTVLKVVAAAALLSVVGGPLAAQASVVAPRAKLDSTQIAVQQAIFQLRDSLKFVDAASARIARDLKMTSNQALISRGRHLSERCDAAARAVPTTLTVVTTARRPDRDPEGVRRNMEAALKEVADQMDRCRAEFGELATEAKVQELRDYGIGRGARVRGAIRRYEDVLRRYYAVVFGARYTPDLTGAGEIPHGS
jgi:DNA replicative helicase MCM subunit Mcm2 (Cdc46/Mcm family)